MITQEEKQQHLKKINVLDHGYVELVDFMGDDAAIANAARISYTDVKKRSTDRGLIRYLIEHRHTSPVEAVVFQFKHKLPIFVARQLVRTRTARLNEISGRYSELTEEFYIPEIERMQKQSQTNKQGSSSELIPTPDGYRKIIESHSLAAFSLYHNLLDPQVDLAKELARIGLTLNTYTEWTWQIDLHNLMHFLKLRLDAHAQYEIRVYAQAMYDLVKPIVPLAMEAFDNFILNAETFAADEMKFLKIMIAEMGDTPVDNILQKMLHEPDLTATKHRRVTAFCKRLSIPYYILELAIQQFEADKNV